MHIKTILKNLYPISSRYTRFSLSLIFLTQTGTAFANVPVPNIPIFPEVPVFGDFNPNQLRRDFNQFIGVEPNYQRENRLIDQIEDAILDGEVEYLPLKNGRNVFSIYLEGELDKPKGGAIILHNRGHHANWADTIKPLRVGLAKKGWNTLSLQMPVLAKGAKYYDYVPTFPYAHQRIKAAINFYKKQGIDNIVLIAHGCGAHMAMSYFDKYVDKNIKAFVGIGMGATDYKQKLIKPYPLEKMKIPVLDIFAENDFLGVLRLSKIRKPKLNAPSQQMMIKNASHYYTEEGAMEDLLNAIDGYLKDL